jgi:Amt family ammonium transporter
MMFAIISPLLITGSYAERVGARTSLVFSVLWSIVVYYPVAHWVWGGGWLKQRGVLDFAGGIVLHTTAGAAAIVSALFVGRRVGFELVHGEFPPSNLPLAALGVSGLWIGWFFFNGASALASNGIALSAALSTQIGAATCAIVYYIFSSVHLRNRPSFVAMMNGLVAGMAGITPASGYITTGATLGLGAVLGLTYWGAVILKRKLHIDDALDVSIVHGLTGVIGSIAIGLCATTSEKAPFDGVFYGGEWKFFGWQCLAVLVCGVWSAVMTFIIWFLMNKVRRVRFDIVAETNGIGLDLHDHGEYAYHGLRLAGKEPLFESLLSELDNEESVKSPLLNTGAAAVAKAIRQDAEGSSSGDDDDNEQVGGDGVAASPNAAVLRTSAQNRSINGGESFGDINQMTREQKKSLLLRLARSSRKPKSAVPDAHH